jgi:aspartyl protease family protein
MSGLNQANPNRRTGFWMLFISLAFGLGVLTLFFDSLLSNRNNPNRDPISQTGSDGSVTVELLRNTQGHYLVSGLINGASANFLLDTGATDVVMSEQLAQQAMLERGFPTRAMTANGEVIVYSASVDALEIGGIVLNQVRASINPAMRGNTVLLGMSALQHIEFTQRGDSLTLRYIP